MNTDVEYAQAAIDMLPGTVEEIVEFLAAQKIESKWIGCKCPITRYVDKWVDGNTGMGTFTLSLYQRHVHMGRLDVTPAVRDYVRYVDGQKPNGL